MNRLTGFINTVRVFNRWSDTFSAKPKCCNNPVITWCHAPAVFKNTKNTDGTSLVDGKKVTGFTNEEEEAVQLTNVVPFLVENMLKKNGGLYSKKEVWTPYAVEDGLLITGQNPASSELVAEMLSKKLN